MTVMLERPTAMDVPSGTARFRALCRTLLDMEEQAATVFWRPSERGYDSRLTTPFGEPPRIPEPFGCDLDTSGFKTPAGEPDGAEGR
ncbi:hypothetical protein IQ279_02715 [Streptomyces verrucosisporus]|uniref:hypothetical protein n=1 Tax=Streptomyces verrucosisporus TaxID=1695161 RepID=UPI0019D1ABA2|nr:hypothetical protein [Streptomyces verrucosisporus]MBN3928568.1 hypothetical protein [Streptomyces verrucosisporus]